LGASFAQAQAWEKASRRQNGAKGLGNHLSGQIGVRLLLFGPHPVTVEKLDPRLFQGLFDRCTRATEGISAPAFEPPNSLQHHAGLHRELVLSSIERGAE